MIHVQPAATLSYSVQRSRGRAPSGDVAPQDARHACVPDMHETRVKRRCNFDVASMHQMLGCTWKYGLYSGRDDTTVYSVGCQWVCCVIALLWCCSSGRAVCGLFPVAGYPVVLPVSVTHQSDIHSGYPSI